MTGLISLPIELLRSVGAFVMIAIGLAFLLAAVYSIIK